MGSSKFSTKYRKRRFCGNKHQKVTKADVPSDPKSPATSTPFQSKSAKKTNFCAESVTDNVINLDKSSSYMIMNTGILSSIIEDFLFAQTVC